MANLVGLKLLCSNIAIVIVLIFVSWLCSCSNDSSNYSLSRNIDTYEKWVERYRSGVKQDESIFSQDNEKIRQSFVEFINEGYMKKVHGDQIPNDPKELRINEMVTTLDDGNTLLIYNLGNLMETDQEEFTNGFFDKIIDYQIDSSNLDQYDSAVFGFIDTFFTKLIIHNEYHDGIRFTHQDRDELECSGTAFMGFGAKAIARMDEMKVKATALKLERKK